MGWTRIYKHDPRFKETENGEKWFNSVLVKRIYNKTGHSWPRLILIININDDKINKFFPYCAIKISRSSYDEDSDEGIPIELITDLSEMLIEARNKLVMK